MKKLNNFNNFLNESNGRLVQIALDLDLDDDGMVFLQELIEQFNLQIINLWPLGPGGGAAEVTFRGESNDILDMLEWYSELTGEDAGSYYDTYRKPDAPIPFKVQSDSRMVTFRKRKYVGVNGKPIMK
jgi:hypothetical protein